MDPAFPDARRRENRLLAAVFAPRDLGASALGPGAQLDQRRAQLAAEAVECGLRRRDLTPNSDDEPGKQSAAECGDGQREHCGHVQNCTAISDRVAEARS
jgi:hypothetical protein